MPDLPPRHKPTTGIKKHGLDDLRGSSAERGYDWRWRTQIRTQKLRHNPVCEECQKHSRVSIATEVDHIDGNSSHNWPGNLQSLCKSCHSRKTVREQGGFGR